MKRSQFGLIAIKPDLFAALDLHNSGIVNHNFNRAEPYSRKSSLYWIELS